MLPIGRQSKRVEPTRWTDDDSLRTAQENPKTFFFDGCVKTANHCTVFYTPTLRETRMPAVSLELGPARFVVERGLAAADAIARGLSRWADGPCLDLS